MDGCFRECTDDIDIRQKQYTAKVVAHVKYSAWAQDQTTLTKHGVITFNVVPGDETHHYNITNSTLEMTT